MNRVFVLSSTKQPLMPCKPARARKLLSAGKAAVYRMYPFTIILKDRESGDTQEVELKVDPGSGTTGISLVALFARGRVLVWAAELLHTSSLITRSLTARRGFRANRRSRKTRYRKNRIRNRGQLKKGWMAPSLRSIVSNVRTWTVRLKGMTPISSAAVEIARIDVALLNSKTECSELDYAKGPLYGFFNRKEFILERDKYTCSYCGIKGVPMEIDHVVPKSKGGSNSVTNLVCSCVKCNQEKANRRVDEFVTDPEKLKSIKSRLRLNNRDAAITNGTKHGIVRAIKGEGISCTSWPAALTKYNRHIQDHKKEHWVDAACVGKTGSSVEIDENTKPLIIKATGRGRRRAHLNDKYGFPKGKARSRKRVGVFQTGDMVRLDCPKGKYKGTHVGRLSYIKADIGWLGIGGICRRPDEFTLLQKVDGYSYSW